MSEHRLYIVYGTGNDKIGLVGHITAPIASAKGNIVDLRQDVLHGLFTIFMVVDLVDSELRIDDFTALVERIGEDTGLDLAVDKYTPVPRTPNKKNMLLILVGHDAPGITALVCETLGKYNANIEFAKNIGREGVFLMELMTDISNCTIPLPNLMQVVRDSLSAMAIETLFQTEDVFNKKKRVLLFDIRNSLLPPALMGEIMAQTGIGEDELTAAYDPEQPLEALRRAVAHLEGLPLDTIDCLVKGLDLTSGAVELLETLRIMGYGVALVSRALTFFTDPLQQRMGLDYCYGVTAGSDDDTRTVTGELEQTALPDVESVIAGLIAHEGVAHEDVTILATLGSDAVPGIRLEFNPGVMLDCFNQHILSRENLIGVLGSFGVPHLALSS